MFDFVVQTEPLTIDAPAEAVWNVLTDGERYGEWSPFTTHIETDFRPGSLVRAVGVRPRAPAGRGRRGPAPARA